MKFILFDWVRRRRVILLILLLIAASLPALFAFRERMNRREAALRVLDEAALDGWCGEAVLFGGGDRFPPEMRADEPQPTWYERWRYFHPLQCFGWSRGAAHSLDKFSIEIAYVLRRPDEPRPPLDARHAEALACFPECRSLLICDTELRTDFLPALAARCKFVNLALDKCRLTDDDCRHIADMPTLEVVWLMDNPRIGDAGAAYLRHLPALKGLSLRGTGITDAACTADQLSPRLERLDLDETAVSERAILKLALLPNLRRIGCGHLRRGGGEATIEDLEGWDKTCGGGWCDLDPSRNRHLPFPKGPGPGEPYDGEPDPR